jgi:hypothetical protein
MISSRQIRPHLDRSIFKWKYRCCKFARGYFNAQYQRPSSHCCHANGVAWKRLGNPCFFDLIQQIILWPHSADQRSRSSTCLNQDLFTWR